MSDDSESDEGGFLRYGTPLDRYDEDQVPKKKSNFQDITEQYAYDSNGRRRFHGAFTGGFSAGHFNSVALPEGWTPQTFKSSRSDRATLQQKPEDFMDDEDRSEFGFAPRQVETTEEFSGTKNTKKRKQFSEGPIPGEPVLHSLLEAVHETSAMRILKKMGWRPGRGVGERVTTREKKRSVKMYTCYVPAEFRQNVEPQEDSEESETVESDDEYQDFLFEPDDLKPYAVKPKNDCFGLGYSGLSRLSILGGDGPEDKLKWKGSHLVMNDKGKKVSIRGQAFGVGALEEEDDDIYAKDDMSHYDFSLEGPKKSAAASNNRQAASLKFVLSGFTAATIQSAPMKVYLPPTLPRDYVPDPNARKTRFGPAIVETQPPTRDRGLGRHDLSADQRGKLLGELKEKETVVAPPTPVVNPNPTPEERIAAIAGRHINFTNDDKTEEPPKPEQPIEDDPNSKDFKPFSNNPAKQARYEKFVVEVHAGTKANEFTCCEGLSKWDAARELMAFQQAFKLYRPLTGTMSDRFVSAGGRDLDPSEIVKKTLQVSEQKREAARLEKFGSLTRDMTDWKPDPLLCRRFNIAEPVETRSAVDNKPKYSIFTYLENPTHDKYSYSREQNDQKSFEVDVMKNVTEEERKAAFKKPADQHKEPEAQIPTKNNRMSVAELFLQEKEKEKSISVEEPKEDEPEVTEAIDNFNKIDLYKAIFLSDSESEEEAPKPVKSAPAPPSIPSISAAPANVEFNKAPAQGIFANLNFNKLNSWRNGNDSNEVKKPIEKVVEAPPVRDSITDVEMYGPRLPDAPELKNDDKNTSIVISSSDSDDWMETDTINKISKKSKKSKKSGKKKKKSKSPKRKHSHKSKHKHKK